MVGEEPADVYYKVDEDYNPSAEGGIIWSDPELAIPWPLSEPVVSSRDGALPGIAEYRARAVFRR